jgi:hypothetical protein
MGLTTLMLSVANWYANTFPNSLIFFTTHSYQILDACRLKFCDMNKGVKLKICFKDELGLHNGSRILFKPAKLESFCSTVYDMMFIDNAAYTDGSGGWWSGIRSHIKKNGYLWVNSTPTDTQSWFYQTWVNTKRNNKLRIPWNKREDRGENWYNTTKYTFPKKSFNREILTQFV